jgi:hypothetical protein
MLETNYPYPDIFQAFFLFLVTVLPFRVLVKRAVNVYGRFFPFTKYSITLWINATTNDRSTKLSPMAGLKTVKLIAHN